MKVWKSFEPATSAVDAALHELRKFAAVHAALGQFVVMHAVLYGPPVAALLKSHWYAPLAAETVSQKTFAVVVIGVPTAAVAHAPHADVPSGMGLIVLTAHAVTAVVEQ